MLCGTHIGLELADMPRPIPCDARGNWEPAVCIFDCRLQRTIQPEAAVGFENGFPGIERTRHRDGMNRIADFGHALGAKRFV